MFMCCFVTLYSGRIYLYRHGFTGLPIGVIKKKRNNNRHREINAYYCSYADYKYWQSRYMRVFSFFLQCRPDEDKMHSIKKQLIHSHHASTYVNFLVDEKEQWSSGVEFSWWKNKRTPNVAFLVHINTRRRKILCIDGNHFMSKKGLLIIIVPSFLFY
jgi:hypothetical protein